MSFFDVITTVVNGFASSSVDSGAGVWNPLVLAIALFVLVIFVLIIRAFGNKDYNKNTDQTKPFMSGNVDQDDDENVSASNMYWGFFEALKPLYKPILAMHNGNLNDYIGIFMAMLAVVLLLILFI
jgi:hypothetical protein